MIQRNTSPASAPRSQAAVVDASPTPWRNIHSVIISDVLPRDGAHHICGMTVTNNDAAKAEANAVFIVKAVNSHDALVKALEKVRSYNVDIAAGRINYRPHDHIQVIDEALAAVEANSLTPDR